MSPTVPTSAEDDAARSRAFDDPGPAWVASAIAEVPSALASSLARAGRTPPTLPEAAPATSWWLDLRLAAAPLEAFAAAFGRLTLRIDGEIELRPAEHPSLLLARDDRRVGHGAWTWIAASALPPDWFGQPHSLEIRDDDTALFGPVERFVADRASGPILDHLEDDQGRLILEIRADPDAPAAGITFLTDLAFGHPTSVAELEPEGAARPLGWHPLGVAMVGGEPLGQVWKTEAFRPRHPRVVLAIRLPRPGRGVALALTDGFVRDAALRVDATVL
ncbi:MAG TPA: hypothetical protein VFW86_02375 [Candidatus Limnocylindrales bacterium]|nr:hypothetical protein [Candidatus Limnocylindrales bacterium]